MELKELRYIRLRDAPTYLGMNKNYFNTEVRPSLIEIPIGSKGIAFDRLDLDAWAAHYKECKGRPAKQPQRRASWDVKERQACLKETGYGTSTSTSVDNAFEKAVKLVTSKKPKDM